MNRFLLALLGVPLLFSSSPAKSAEIHAKPNVVFIVADDMGYADMGTQHAATSAIRCKG